MSSKRQLVTVVLFPVLITIIDIVLFVNLWHHEASLSHYFDSPIMVIGGVFFVFMIYFFAQLFAKDQNTKLSCVASTILLIPTFILVFAFCYFGHAVCGPIVASTCVNTDAREVLYFSVVTFSTLGYGDLRPLGEMRGVAATEALFGFIFIPALISQLVAFVREHASSNSDNS